MQAHNIDYLPGSAELGDFDATSTSIALSPVGEQQLLPPEALLATFERYWKDFAARRTDKGWDAYTPYEWRNLGTFIRLRWRDRGMELIDFLMNDRRPREWNQWAEVVGREPRKSRFVGDMPHGWVASDYGRSLLDMFAFERPADETLVLMAGVPKAWTEHEGFAVKNLRTPFGPLSYSLRVEDKQVVLDVEEIRDADRRAGSRVAGRRPARTSVDSARSGAVDRHGAAHHAAAVHDRVPARSGRSMSGFVERGAVRRDHSRIEMRARLRRALQRLVVDVHQAEALGEAVGPFEVVEQRPGEVAADVGALPDRVVHGAQMLAQVVDTQRIFEHRAFDAAADRRTPRRSR